MSEFKLNICHLYPDLLNLYGDTGNILCMKKRLEWRGIDCEVTGLSVGDNLDAGKYDLFFIGGGQDFEQDVLLADADRNKKADIKSAIEDDKAFLAICGGYQILGHYYKTWEGQIMEFMGCIDIWTEGKEGRLIGNYMFTSDELDGQTVVGFENHSGRTYLGEGIRPIGKVLAGNGNNGEDGTEGARYRNVFCTYCHGPMLPKNPDFCDLILSKALERKYGDIVLEKLNDDYEREAHAVIERRLSQKG